MSNVEIGMTDDGKISFGFPANKENIRNFIGELLKSPQSILFYHYGVFDFARADIEDVFFRVDNRIKEQHDSQLIQFSLSIAYDDRTVMTLHSIEEFRKFSDTKKAICVGISMNFAYLVNFPQADVPKKQSIKFDVRIPIMASIKDGRYVSWTFDDIGFFRHSKGVLARISCQIDHSHQTLGFDIENIIKLFLRGEEIIDQRAYFFKKYGSILMALVALLFFSVSTYVFGIEFYNDYKMSINEENISLLAVYEELHKGKYWIYFVIIMIPLTAILAFGLIMGIVYLVNEMGKPRPSFIRLSEFHDQKAKFELKKHNTRFIAMLGSPLLALSISLIASAIWAFVI